MSRADEYARLMTAFDELLELEPAARSERLARWHDSDASLARQLEALLDASAVPESPLERGPRVTDWGTLGLASTRSASERTPASGGAKPLPAQIGEIVGMYRLTQVIGRGGMGCVFRAEHVELGRAAAVKVLDPVLGADPDYVSRFLHEAKIVNAVHHPNIVDIYDFIDTESPRRVAFVMELLSGVTLGKILSQRALTPEEAMRATFQLCQALSAVHALGIVHRDLKPDNVMVVGRLTAPEDEGPTIKLLDFGIAKVSDPLAMHRTASGAVIGTPTYMAPEQFSAEGVTPATDVYAVAELLYEMLTQRAASTGHGLSMIRKKMSGVPSDIELPRSLPHAEVIESLLHDCLQVEPRHRPTLHHLQSELTALFPDLAPGAATRRREQRRNRRDAVEKTRTGPKSRLPERLAPIAFAAAAIVWLVWLATRPDASRLDIPEQFIPEGAGAADLQPGRDAPESAEGHPTGSVDLPLVVYADGEQTPLYLPTGRMGFGQGLTIDFQAKAPDSDQTCMQVTFDAPLPSWAGVVWQDPPHDWGTLPGGYALTGATRLSLRAKGQVGGEKVKFGYGIILRDAKYFDSAREEREFTLSDVWETYQFDLTGQDLHRIKTGFWLAVETRGGPVTFYVDDVRYE